MYAMPTAYHDAPSATSSLTASLAWSMLSATSCFCSSDPGFAFDFASARDSIDIA
jgi:hypothetical protein